MNATFAMARRMLCEISPRLLWKFGYDFGFKGMRAVNRFKRRLAQGKHFPAFLVISVTSRCNLQCRGCWVTQDPEAELSPEQLEPIIQAAKSQGSFFFGILGGEPLLYKGLFGIFERHRDCYFQLFTNGTLLTDEVAQRLRRLGNVTPLISIEGLDEVGDERRGGVGVYGQAMAAIDACRRQKLVIGVATSVCQSNYAELVSRDFIERLVACGVHYMWYYIFRPVGVDPSPKLCLDARQVRELRQFIVDARTWAPLMLVDAYWDDKGEGVCPAAMGLSHHISPTGYVEPCPVIQLAADHIDSGDLVETIETSTYLTGFKAFASGTTRGCILLDAPGKLRQFAIANRADDSSGRGTALDELAVMRPRASHQMEKPIPERNWFYRFAKKHWFFGFGAYG